MKEAAKRKIYIQKTKRNAESKQMIKRLKEGENNITILAYSEKIACREENLHAAIFKNVPGVPSASIN